MEVAKLHNRIQDFAWGSESYLPQLLGYENPEQKPQAELWMGVHPLGESRVEGASEGTLLPLSEYLQESESSEHSAAQDNLPFLFKVLAAKQPLSIQVHPNKVQAEAGFLRENRAGIAAKAPNRNYKDPNHKPEIALALTPFWALCGFRSIDEIRQNFAHFESDCIDFDDHQSFFFSLMQLEREPKEKLLQAARQSWQNPTHQYAPELALWLERLAGDYPGDLGTLAPLYLHLFCLQPGEAIYLSAGILHAYLEGSVMELMSNSDNVLRGGLTAKHKDLAELMSTVIFEEFPLRIIKKCEMDVHRSYYPTTAEEFRLERWELRPENSSLYFPSGHPVMLAFVFAGAANINGVHLGQGQSCIIPASSGEVTAKAAPKEPEGKAQNATLYVAAAKEFAKAL